MAKLKLQPRHDLVMGVLLSKFMGEKKDIVTLNIPLDPTTMGNFIVAAIPSGKLNDYKNQRYDLKTLTRTVQSVDRFPCLARLPQDLVFLADNAGMDMISSLFKEHITDGLAALANDSSGPILTEFLLTDHVSEEPETYVPFLLHSNDS
jgi:hypothetical protein